MYAAIFFASFAALAFEVLLVRIFSILLWYHFAFMVVSIAMLGLAVSGTALALAWAGRRGPPPGPSPLLFPLLGAAMALAYLAAVRIPFDPVRLSWDRGQILYVSLYYVVLAVPFFINGLILSSAFASSSYRPGSVYGADLTGAAAGTVAVVGLQFLLSPGQAVLVCAALASAGGILTGGAGVRSLAAAWVVSMGALAAYSPPLTDVPFSPYKDLPVLLRMKGSESLDRVDSPYGRVDLFRSPGTRHAPGLSLRFAGEIPVPPGLSIDGSSVSTVSSYAMANDSDYIDYLPSSLAFSLRGGGRVLLVDPRGGVSAVAARRYGATRVVCSESNPAVVEILRRAGLPDSASCGGETRSGMARNLLLGGGESFDLIDVPLSGTMAGAGQLGGGEDYLLTVEGIASLIDGLTAEGILNISLFISPPFRSELRLFSTVLASLEHLAVPDPSSQVIVLRSLEALTVLVKRSPFTAEELSASRRFLTYRWFDMLFPRGTRDADGTAFIRTEDVDLPAAFSALADPSQRGAFTREYPFDISPPTDDSPYFHDSLRLATLPRVYRLVGGKWEFFLHEGYLHPFVLGQASLLGLLLILLPAAAGTRGGRAGGGRALLFFALLGTGYMFVEIGLLHKAILSLEHPVHSLAAVIGSILVASGAGSYSSRGWGPRRLWKAALAAGALVLALSWSAEVLFASLPRLPLPLRVPVVAFAAALPGFFMGTLFPGGIRYLRGDRRRLIPWAWGINGLCSVVSPVSAVMLASAAGYAAVLLVGALCYFGASAAGAGFCAGPTMGTKRTPPI